MLVQQVGSVVALTAIGAGLGAGCGTTAEPGEVSTVESTREVSASASSSLPAYISGGIIAPPAISNAAEEALTGAVLQGYQFRFDAKGTSELDTITDSGVVFRASDGEKFVAVRYSYSGQPPGNATPDAPGASGQEFNESVSPPTATLIVDGKRTDIPDLLTTGTKNYLAMSVPEDAREILLEMDQAGVAQTLDLSTGERDPDAPEILYRESSQRVETETSFTYLRSTFNRTFDLPFTFSGMTDSCLDNDGDQDTTAITVSGVDLQYWMGSTPLVQATPTTALLQLVAEGRTSNKQRMHGPIPVEQVSVTDATGASYPVKSAPSGRFSFTNGDLYAEVPADITAGSVTLTLGIVPITSANLGVGCSGNMDFGGAVVTVPFTFD